MDRLKYLKEIFPIHYFPEIKKELIDLHSYEDFLEQISRIGLDCFEVLWQLRDSIFFSRIISHLENHAVSQDDINFITVLKITLFITLIECYMDNKLYVKYDEFLGKHLESDKQYRKKQIMKIISEYQSQFSLSAGVRNFLLMATRIDQIWLSSCIEEELDFQKEKSSLRNWVIIPSCHISHRIYGYVQLKTDTERSAGREIY